MSDGTDPLRGSEDRIVGEEEAGPRELRIVNKKGLHARASARFVETVQAHDATVLVEKDGEEVSGTDLLGLLMLAGTQGTTIEVSATGPDARPALDALEALVTDGFGEETQGAEEGEVQRGA